MTEIISLPMRAGKTYKAIQKSRETGAIIITFNKSEAKRIMSEAEAMGFKIPMPLTMQEAFQHSVLRGKANLKYIIDNADICLRGLFGGEIIGITVTGKELQERTSCAQPRTSIQQPSCEKDGTNIIEPSSSQD